MKLYNVLQGSRMATRRLPATPILLFLITVDHQRIDRLYININVRVKRWFGIQMMELINLCYF